LGPSADTKRFEELDGLRGLAALAVLFNHVGLATIGGVSAPKWLIWPADGTVAVMVFFVLSGYVIGLTYPPAAGKKDVRHYGFKRFVRLMPINVVAVLLACAVTAHPSGWSALANVFFLGNFAPYAGVSIPVIEGNENLWSLNYEVLYYGLFILIWVMSPRLAWVMGVSLVVAVVGWYTNLLPLFVACYAAGFLFWVSGLALAWRVKPAGLENSNWPSCVLLLLVTWKLRGLLNLLTGLPIPVFDGPVARLYYLDTLPVCIWLLSIVARRPLPGIKWIQAFCVLMPVVGLVIKFNRPGYFTPFDYWMTLSVYVLALLLWKWRPTLRFFRALAPLGSIAFAVYAVGRPLQAWMFGHGQWLPANYFGYGVCAVATVGVCLALSWFLERRMQPWISRKAKILWAK
jgi:peptidoglycan/LPS O-acetylase OafA/YrhL